jgi:hypothetical protein
LVEAGVLECPDLMTAAEQAALQLAAVRESPGARLRLLVRTYGGPTGDARRHLPFRRAAQSFMNWQLDREVLNPPDHPRPGSPWWRAVNERLLYDGCEAVAIAGGLPADERSSTTGLWEAFVAGPSPSNWYRAHNGSIVAAYIEKRDLAEAESEAERFFLNVVLLRVLYAHALVAAPDLALGRLAALGRLLGDPRLGMAGVFLSLGRVLPDRYPLDLPASDYIARERGLGRLLDYAVIAPRLQILYRWSADILGQPRLLELIEDGNPTYVWSPTDRGVWAQPTRRSALAGPLAKITSPRRSFALIDCRIDRREGHLTRREPPRGHRVEESEE